MLLNEGVTKPTRHFDTIVVKANAAKVENCRKKEVNFYIDNETISIS
jgi:hypothetical protein